jgi:hypothetical protein
VKLAGLASARLVLSAFAALMIPVPGQGQVWRSTLYPENWQRPPVTASFYDDKLIQDFSYAGTSGEAGSSQIPSPIHVGLKLQV